ncbi:MAG: TetR/AcrR family transcriptional regulator [Gordonia paraffinivorans]
MSSDDVAVPRYLEVLWDRPSGTRRGPKPGVGIRDIGAAGVRVADRGGAETISMKAVATELGMTSMSLYRYVTNKDELLAVVLDEAYGPCPRDTVEGGTWRERVESWTRAIAAALTARPWIVDIPLSAPPATPNVLGWTDAGVAAFEGTGLPARSVLSSLLVLDGFVRNHVRQSTQLGALRADGSRAPDDRSYEKGILALVGDTGRLPALAAAAAEISHGEASDFYADELDYGIAVLLDGLTHRVESVRSDPSRETDRTGYASSNRL